MQIGEQRSSRRPLWWRVLGLRRRKGKWIGIGLTLWGWALVVVLAAVIGGTGFAEYSMQPEFCRSCHIMEPYYQAWHRSTHKDVACQDCHFEPGWRNTLKGKYQASAQVAKYLTRTYGTKPHAEIRDESCLRSGCHEKRLLEGKVRWGMIATDGEPIEVSFDHTPHLGRLRRGKQLRCVSCHSQIVQGEHLTVTLDTCFICHFKGLRHGRDNEVLGGCRSCHDAPRHVIQMELGLFDHQEYVARGVACENCHSDSVSGDGQVPKQVCGNCHNQAEHLARFEDTDFLHSNHVTSHKIECTNCHIQIEHQLSASARDRSGSCGACHMGNHGGPAELYFGVGGRGVPDMPSPMARSEVDCIACHRHRQNPESVAEIAGQTFTAVGESCTYCHGPKYDGTLEEWEQRITAKQDETAALYARTEAALAGAELSASTRRRARSLLADAEHNRLLVKLGRGVHNVNYATALLNAANEFCRQAEAMVARTAAESPGRAASASSGSAGSEVPDPKKRG
ncbi:MAG: NapC/NirT family cytochrome c [Phycisphaerales bacterium]|nr:MAG: NapC/NirT family cytochrome c [Phycisphaerales bacterium]